MTHVEWDDSYNVGDPLIDTHHQVFFRMVRQFAEFAEGNDGDRDDAMKKRIAFLVEYAAMHFGAEERLMRDRGYPGVEAHTRTHQAFSRQILVARDSFIRNPKSVTPEQMLELMQNWFFHHVLGEDMKLKPFLARQP